MRFHKIAQAVFVTALSAFGLALPAQAVVTTFISAGSTCTGGSTGSFAIGSTTQISVCVTTTTEGLCSSTLQLRAAVGQNNNFSITNRVLGTATPDAATAAPTYPIFIINPADPTDFGGSVTASAAPAPAANQLLATFTIQPQASATLASYVITGGAVSEVTTAVPGANCFTASTPTSLSAASITLTRSAAPAFTSAAPAAGVVNTAYAHTFTASGAPSPTFAVTAGTLPAGLTLANTGALTGTPTATGTFGFTVTASNGNAPAATQVVSLVISAGAQTITFANPGAKPFSTTAFASNATASSGLVVTLASTTTAVCTVSGLNITMVTAGTCTITADQAGNASFGAAPQVSQTFTITAVAPGAPTIGAGTGGNNSATVAFTAPASNGGSAIIDYNASCVGTPNANVTGTASPLTVAGLTNGNAYTCSVTARNALGSSVASGTVSVTPSQTPVAPTFTSANAATFAFGVAGTFNVTATGFPLPTFATASARPDGVTLSAAGVLSGTPTAAGVFPLSIVATGTAPAATQVFTLTVSTADQTITFGAITAKAFDTSPLAVTATSTATPASAATFTSSTPTVCTIAAGAASVVFVAAGTCTIVANHSGNANFNAAPAVTQSFAITATPPGAPTILPPRAGNLLAFITFTQSTVNGGSAILDYTATCTGGANGPVTQTTPGTGLTATTVVSFIVRNLVNGTTYTCSVTARNVAGVSPASATVSVTPVPIVPPDAPTILSATPGNGQASIQFAAPTVNGGSVVTGYAAACTPGAFTATGTDSPLVVTGLTNGTQYTCSVRAANVAGQGVASGTLTVTPADIPLQLFSSSNPAAFGAPITLTAAVNGSAPTGTITFTVSADSGNLTLPGCAAVPLVGGLASCNAPGSYQNVSTRFYQATYSGNATNPGAALSLAQNVNMNLVVLSVAAYPLPPVVAGRTVTLSALVKMVSPSGTVTVFDNGAPITGCTQIPVAVVTDTTDSGVANCNLVAPSSPSGVKQYVVAYNYPAGHISGRLFEQVVYNLRVNAQGPVDYTDMWWAGVAENGWGISINQHGGIQFNVIFAYDAAGKPLWYVMPAGIFNAAGTTVTGALYLPTSSPFSAYDRTKFVVGAPVGNATITYTGNNAATLAYTINGISATKSIQRQLFAPETTAPNLRTNDIWWGTAAEDGWGINIAQQGRVLFPVWYTYDAAGKAIFFTAQNGSWKGTVWSGTVVTHTSSAWLGVPYVASAFTATAVGTIALDFSDASNATMSYTVNGFTQVKRIERVVY